MLGKITSNLTIYVCITWPQQQQFFIRKNQKGYKQKGYKPVVLLFAKVSYNYKKFFMWPVKITIVFNINIVNDLPKL